VVAEPLLAERDPSRGDELLEHRPELRHGKPGTVNQLDRGLSAIAHLMQHAVHPSLQPWRSDLSSI
jgi:hypothetical protein